MHARLREENYTGTIYFTRTDKLITNNERDLPLTRTRRLYTRIYVSARILRQVSAHPLTGKTKTARCDHDAYERCDAGSFGYFCRHSM